MRSKATSEAAASSIGVDVQSLREHRADLGRRRKAIVHRPVPKVMALARLDTACDALLAGGIATIPLTSFTQPDGGNAELVVSQQFGPFNHAFAMSLLADSIRHRLRARIEAAYGDANDGITEEERTIALDGIDQEIWHTELAEEALIREAEAKGVEILRRQDADPRAVLAFDADLPR